jgi:hypothetical protein
MTKHVAFWLAVCNLAISIFTVNLMAIGGWLVASMWIGIAIWGTSE